MSAKEELAALKREVEELKARLSPPKPFTPEPFQRYDPMACVCRLRRWRRWSTLFLTACSATSCMTTGGRAHQPA